MSDTLPPLSLKKGLDVWLNNRDISVTVEGEHFSALEMLHSVRDGGVKNLSEPQKKHLSQCRECLGKWLDLVEEQVFVEEIAEEKTSDDWYAGGMLEAASAQVSSAVVLKSNCGRFQLSLYPDSDKQGAGMITLEFVGNNGDQIEGKWVTVRDLNGEMLLDGSVRAGRLASISDNFDSIDLQKWSVQVHEESQG